MTDPHTQIENFSYFDLKMKFFAVIVHVNVYLQYWISFLKAGEVFAAGWISSSDLFHNLFLPKGES